MKNLKQLLATGTMMAALMVGTTFAGTGLLVSDLSRNPSGDPCQGTEETSLTGILLSDFTGILVSDYTGILVSDYTTVDNGATEESPCGIIVHG